MKAAPQKPAKEDLTIVMPSVAELFGLLSPVKVLALEGAVYHHSEKYREMIKNLGSTDSPMQFTAFVIPLDSHLALPEAYASTMHAADVSASMTIVHHAAMNVQVGSEKVRVVLSVLVVALAGDDTGQPLAALDKTTIMRLYREAIRIANHTLIAYKLTPGRHNHDLRPVAVLDRPSYVDILRFDATIGHILERGTIQMHSNLMASLLHAREAMDKDEHTDIRRAFQALGPQSDAPAATILTTIYQAMDALCVGNNTATLVLADTYAEHCMRYTLLVLYTHTGMKKEVAMQKLEDLRTLERLLTALSAALGSTRKKLVQTIGFEEWRQACRYKRNHITHRFTKTLIEPTEARSALSETVRLTTLLAELTMKKFPTLQKQMYLFRTPGWYMQSPEYNIVNTEQSLSDVKDIVKYTYGDIKRDT